MGATSETTGLELDGLCAVADVGTPFAAPWLDGSDACEDAPAELAMPFETARLEEKVDWTDAIAELAMIFEMARLEENSDWTDTVAELGMPVRSARLKGMAPDPVEAERLGDALVTTAVLGALNNEGMLLDSTRLEGEEADVEGGLAEVGTLMVALEGMLVASTRLEEATLGERDLLLRLLEHCPPEARTVEVTVFADIVTVMVGMLWVGGPGESEEMSRVTVLAGRVTVDVEMEVEVAAEQTS